MRALFLPVKSGLPGGARRVFCFERKPMNLTLASGKVTKSFVAGALALSVSWVAVPASFAAPSTPESQNARRAYRASSRSRILRRTISCGWREPLTGTCMSLLSPALMLTR